MDKDFGIMNDDQLGELHVPLEPLRTSDRHAFESVPLSTQGTATFGVQWIPEGGAGAILPSFLASSTGPSAPPWVDAGEDDDDEPTQTDAEMEAEFVKSGRKIPTHLRRRADVSRGQRQAILRRIIGAIAYDLADNFGFQKTQELPGVGSVLSSVANQVDHLTNLLSNRMDACVDELGEPKEFTVALYDAIAGLHAKVFANYENWVRRLGLLPLPDEKPTGMVMDDGVPLAGFEKFLLTDAAKTGAVCLDGSPGGGYGRCCLQRS